MREQYIDEIFRAIKSGNFREIFNKAIRDDTFYNNLLLLAKSKREQLFGKKIEVFYPGKEFPSVSITGGFCALQCKHCMGKYLQHMIPITNPQKLKEFCLKHEKSGGVGCLISGGYTTEGYVPLEPFIDAIKWIKENTNLLINVHTGLADEKMAKLLKYAGIDSVSVDVSGDIKIIKDVYGLKKTPEDYLKTLINLKRNNLTVAPHIGIGFYYGKITEHEFVSLEFVRKIASPELVFIIIRPTPSTPFENITPPSLREILSVMALSRLVLDSPISLGCMRPSGNLRKTLDYMAIKYIADRIAVPSHDAVSRLKNEGYEVIVHKKCCTL